MKNLILFFSFFQSYITFAQSVTIDPSNTATNIIDAKSTNQGITVPKMTTIQKGAIANKVEGMLVYDTDLKSFSYWIPNITVPNSGTWQNLSSAGGGANTWNTAGSDISNANGGNVGIGTSIPNAKLEINSGVLNKSGLRLTQLKYSSNGLPISKFADAPNPRGIVFDNFGNAYVSNFTDNKITKIFPNGFSIVFYENTVANPLLSGPHDLSIYNNKLYISNFQSGTIVEMLLSQNIYGGYSSISIYASGFNNPTGLTFDGSGNLFVVNWGNGNLSKISSTGIITQNFGTGLSGAFGCVYNNGNNKIYIANNYVNEIAEIDGLLGGAKTTFKPAINYCTGLTINDVGDMFVTQFNLNKVIKIKDNIISDYVNTDQPWGICLNANEKIFVVNNSLEQVSVVQDAPNEQLFVDSNGDIFKRSSNEAETHYLGESFGGGKIFLSCPEIS